MSLLHRYSYGKKVNGGFHCRFGVKEKIKDSNVIDFIRGVEQMGPVSKHYTNTDMYLKRGSKSIDKFIQITGEA